MNTSLSALRGMMSSFSGSLSASAIGCSRPKGPARFGPGRFCIRPMTRRSAQIMNMVVSSRKRKTIATLSSTIHQMSWLKSASVGSAARGSCQHVRQRPLSHHSGLLSVTVAPCPTPSWARMVDPAWASVFLVTGIRGELGGCAGPGESGGREPDHVVRHRHHLDGNRDRPPVGGHGHLIAVGHPGLGRGRRGHPGHDRPGGAGQRRLAVLHPPAVQQLAPCRKQ